MNVTAQVIRRVTAALVVAPLMLTGACGFDAIPRASVPEADTGQAQCKGGGQSNPLVTEWPASEKANLELMLRQGGVAVWYSGCELRIVRDCAIGGGYAWQRTTPATDVIEMHNVDDLYAKLPLGAASLEGALGQSGRLSMTTTVSGQLILAGAEPYPRGQACGYATHFVAAMSVGAFKLSSGGGLHGRAGLDTPVGGLGAGSRSDAALMRQAGEPERCSEASDAGAHPACGSPIQLFLAPMSALASVAGAGRPAPPVASTGPVPQPSPAPPPAPTDPAPVAPAAEPPPAPTDPAPVAPAPAPPAPTPASTATGSEPAAPTAAAPWLPPAPQGPLGSGPVSAVAGGRPEDAVDTIVIHLVSDDPDTTFVLSAGGKAMCSSPCSTAVRVDDLVVVQELGSDKSEPMPVKELRSYSVVGAIDVTASPRATGQLVGGLVLAAAGGMGFLAGVAMLAIGGHDGNTGLQVAGGLVLGGLTPAIAPGVVLMATFKESLEVTPAKGVTLSFGPGYLGGSF